MKTNFNKNYFDIIDTEDKAYWLGFIWCDGYLGIRNRENRIEYNLNLRLIDSDYKHLEKFNKCIDGEYKIKFIKTEKRGNFKESCHCKLFITNIHLGQTLSEKYGLIPHRTDCTKLLENIPYNLTRHFIRGVLDADGSFTKYETNSKGDLRSTKYTLTFGTTPQLVDFIEDFLIKEGIIDNFKRVKSKRHEDRDYGYISMSICGYRQVINVLGYLYKNSNIYLDRKYEKYLSF